MGVTAWVSRSHLDQCLSDLTCHLEALLAIVTVFLNEAQALHGRNQMISLCFPKQEKEDSDSTEEAVLLSPSGQMTLGVK